MTNRVETIGDATLYLGDCLEILPTLGKVDAVVTDPPYGIGKEDWDRELPTKAIAGFFDIAERICIIPGIWFLGDCIAAMGDKYKWVISGYKPGAMTNGAIGLNKWQAAVIGGDCKRSGYDAFQFHQGNEGLFGHSCQKPLLYMERLIIMTTHDTDTILDPFMGSGTTGVACAKLGRKFIGIEIEPKYFDIACKRIKDAYAQQDMFIEPPVKPVQEGLL